MRNDILPGRLAPAACRLAVVFLIAILATTAGQSRADCTLISTGKTPLNDLGQGLYLGVQGGRYPGGTNTPPPQHLAAAEALAAQIVPLDTDGLEDQLNGRIVFLSIGMSNTSQEFLAGGAGSFMAQMEGDTSKNPKLDILNGALGAHSAWNWTDPADAAWSHLQQVLANANRDPLQVQVIWMKHAERINEVPDQSFPAHAIWHQSNLEQVLRMLQDMFPNLKIAFMSSRTRSYALLGNGGNPEPISYESGFSVKWLIEKQLSGDPSLNYDLNLGTVEAPLIVWGPYLWTDGLDPRSDGFTWLCSDLQPDFIHPSASGVARVAEHLVAYFKTDPLTRSWFLRSTTVGQVPMVGINADQIIGPAPLDVQFAVTANDPDGTITQTLWNFGDGGFALTPSPAKSFPVPGTYPINVTVVDDDGNAVTAGMTITVLAAGAVPAVSTWGCVMFVLALLTTATLMLRAAVAASRRIA